MQASHQRHLVLVGGGHAHLAVLKRFGMRPVAGLRLTLVTDVLEAPYSGRLPAIVAGRASLREGSIDLLRLSRFAGARLVGTRAVGLDPERGRLALADRPDLAFDLVSLDIGSTPPADIPGGAEHALPVKPVGPFLARLDAALAATRAPRLVVIGGGLAGIELAMELRERLARAGAEDGAVTLIARGGVAARQGARGRALLAEALRDAGVTVIAKCAVARIEADAVALADGRRLPCDAAILATGAAAPPWLAETALVLDEKGFIMVDPHLRAVGQPAIFAAGDVASMRETPRERSGVVAVRQGPVLAENLRRALLGRRLRPFRPQAGMLALVGEPGGAATALRGSVAARGRALGRWKEAIDRRWMEGYSRLPAMDPERPPRTDRLPDLPSSIDAMRCGGCAAKLPAASLARALARLGLAADGPQDAAALPAPSAGANLLQSVDLFRAFVEDPYLLGRIAANHALGDLHASGAAPRAALAIAMLPPAAPALMEDDLVQMLAGARRVLEEAGARLVGGHSAEGAELAIGFAVTGEAAPHRRLGKSGLAPGDRLVLTKPLGTGVLLAAEMRGLIAPAHFEATIATMSVSQARAAEIVAVHGARAATDVTGFGLAGHLLEMLDASGCAARLSLAALPALPGALELLTAGIASTLHPANAQASGRISGGGGPLRALLFDPQTAGGLLVGLPAQTAEACLAALRAAGYADAALVGTVEAATPDAPAIRCEP